MKTNKFYFTFGQIHTHSHNGVTLDKDCVLLVEAENEVVARDKMFDAFGRKWSMMYRFVPPDMKYFPRGIIKFNK